MSEDQLADESTPPANVEPAAAATPKAEQPSQEQPTAAETAVAVEPQPEIVESPEPVLQWFHVTTKSEREPLAVRGYSADDVVAKFKQLRGIINTPYPINAVKAIVFTPSARDLEHDKLVNPEAQPKA